MTCLTRIEAEEQFYANQNYDYPPDATKALAYRSAVRFLMLQPVEQSDQHNEMRWSPTMLQAELQRVNKWLSINHSSAPARERVLRVCSANGPYDQSRRYG